MIRRRNGQTLEEYFWSKVQKGDGCWEWSGARFKGGYGRLYAGRRAWTASRLAYELTKGEVPAGMLVCHRCDNPPCCNPDHLWLGTNAENVADRDRKGRAGNKKLSWSEVDAIRGSAEPLTALARRHGVSVQHVHSIRHGRAWPDRREKTA